MRIVCTVDGLKACRSCDSRLLPECTRSNDERVWLISRSMRINPPCAGTFIALSKLTSCTKEVLRVYSPPDDRVVAFRAVDAALRRELLSWLLGKTERVRIESHRRGERLIGRQVSGVAFHTASIWLCYLHSPGLASIVRCNISQTHIRRRRHVPARVGNDVCSQTHVHSC